MRLHRVVVFLLLFVPLAKAAERQVLRGYVPNPAKQLSPLKRVESTNTLDLTIALPLRDVTQLNKLLQEIYDPSSPNYHHYLTPEEFAQRFGLAFAGDGQGERNIAPLEFAADRAARGILQPVEALWHAAPDLEVAAIDAARLPYPAPPLIRTLGASVSRHTCDQTITISRRRRAL